MDSKIKILKQCALFAGTSDSDLKNISRMFISGNIQEGECLAVMEDTATSFFVLVSGMLLLELEGENSIVLDTPGDFAGLSILSQKGIHCSNLTSLTNGEILSIKRNDFLDLIQEDSENAEHIMQAWQQTISEKYPFLKFLESEEFEYQF